MKIRNINEKYGMPVDFEGVDLPECVLAMAQAVAECGHEFGTVDDLCYCLREGVDYEIV
jgi:hypothetical protein